MLLLNLVAEEMDFRIHFQAFFPNLAILTLQYLLGKMGRKKKKEKESPVQQAMNSDGGREAG